MFKYFVLGGIILLFLMPSVAEPVAVQASSSSANPTPSAAPSLTQDQGERTVNSTSDPLPYPIEPPAQVEAGTDPCVDFYQYACGKWMKENPIPPDYSEWVSFAEIYERNLGVLRRILEDAGKEGRARDPLLQKIGDFYASCMDEPAINKAGLTPLQSEIDRIAALKDKSQMMELIAREMLLGSNSILVLTAIPDPRAPGRMVPFLKVDGLTLPGTDYYLKDDKDAIAVRQAFTEHLTKMFILAGQSPESAAQYAGSILKIETELAQATAKGSTASSSENPQRMTSAEAGHVAPNAHLERYFAAADAPPFHELTVDSSSALIEVDALLQRKPLEEWKPYLTWRLLHGAAPWLSDPFAHEDYRFRQTLTGQQIVPARWKQCIDSVETSLADALGRFYVAEAFSLKDKQRVSTMVAALEEALADELKRRSWASETARQAARAKAARIRNKIGYPEVWRDYGNLIILRGDMLGNVQRAAAFENTRQLQKIGKQTDETDWIMTALSVGAYYSPERNEIILPAGILQPPFLNRGQDDAEDFGAIGQIIGHELSHGFDLQGSRYDPSGLAQESWSDNDKREYQARIDCFVREYSAFATADGQRLDGRLTLTENVADNAGAQIALLALHKALTQNRRHGQLKIGGYTADQRFFFGFARVWCENVTPELSRLALHTDPHSPGRWRVNGVLRNMPEFQKAFGCKSGQPMAPPNACRIW